MRFMNLEQWIISIVVGILMFLIVFYVGQSTLLPSLLCAIIGFLGNIYVSIKANKNKS